MWRENQICEKSETEWTWNPKYLIWRAKLIVHWSIGPLKHWTIGLLVYWSIGPLVHWTIGLLDHWSIVHWSISPLVQCQMSKVNKVKLWRSVPPEFLRSFLFSCDLLIFNMCKSQKMVNSEKLCLQWNEFPKIVRSAFEDLRDDHDLTDVTLVCNDGKQVEAHKVVLASCSPFFQELFKRNKHTHPLVFMRGVNSDDLVAMVEFLYSGEANIDQANLDAFLALADDLKL